MLKISLLLALIPANPDVVKTFFSLIYYYTSRFFHILYKNGSLGLSTIMRNLIVLDFDLWLAYFKICLGGLGSCGRTINNFHVHFAHHGQGNYAFERKFVYYFGICVLLELATTTFICTHCCSKINYENEYIKIKN